MTRMTEILHECQKSFAYHKKGIIGMKKLLLNDPNSFQAEFISHLNQILLIFKREPAVERLVQFIVGFATQFSLQDANSEINTNFVFFLIEYLLKRVDVKEKSVRFRSLQLLSGILNHLNEEIDFEEEIWNSILEKCLIRTKDKVPIIRSQAVSTLTKLQNPKDKDDPVLLEYIRLIQFDTSNEVRKSVLDNVGLSRLTLPFILERTKDVKDDVRKYAFLALQKRVPIKVLSISQRSSLLQFGLKDRNVQVQKACISMVHSGWLPSLNGDILKFLGGLAVEQNEAIIELTLQHLFPLFPVTVKFQEEALTNELALLWSVYCKYLKNHQNENGLEEHLPSFTKLCELLKENVDNEFISKQLLSMCNLLELIDETTRRNLSTMLRGVLCRSFYSRDLIKLALENLKDLHKEEEEFNDFVISVLDELQIPLEEYKEFSDLPNVEEPTNHVLEIEDKIEELQTKESKYAKQKKYDEAKQIQLQIEQLQVQLEKVKEEEETRLELELTTWFRCLTVIELLLENLTIPLKLSAKNRLLNLILPAIQHKQPSIRLLGLKCLGLVSLTELEIAQQNVPLFLHALDNDCPEIQNCILKVLFDLALTFRGQLYEEEKKDDASTSDSKEKESQQQLPNKTYSPKFVSLMEKLQTYFYDDDQENRIIAVEGFCKLMVYGFYVTQKLFEELILLFYNPATEEDSKSRQCLSIFFPTFAFSSHTRREVIEDSILSILRRVLYAPPSSLLRKVSATSVAQFLLYLTDATNIKSNTSKENENTKSRKSQTNEEEEDQLDEEKCTKHATSSIEYKDSASALFHLRIGLLLCQEVLSNLSGPEAKLLCKVLPMLHLSKSCTPQEGVKALRFYVNKMQQNILDKPSLKLLNKFDSEKLSVLDSPNQELDSEQTEYLESQLKSHIQAREEWELQQVKERKAPSKTSLSKRKIANSCPAKKRGRKKVEEEISSEEEEDYMEESDSSEELQQESSSNDEYSEEEEVKKPKKVTKTTENVSTKSNPVPMVKESKIEKSVVVDSKNEVKPTKVEPEKISKKEPTLSNVIKEKPKSSTSLLTNNGSLTKSSSTSTNPTSSHVTSSSSSVAVKKESSSIKPSSEKEKTEKKIPLKSSISTLKEPTEIRKSSLNNPQSNIFSSSKLKSSPPNSVSISNPKKEGSIVETKKSSILPQEKSKTSTTSPPSLLSSSSLKRDPLKPIKSRTNQERDISNSRSSFARPTLSTSIKTSPPEKVEIPNKLSNPTSSSSVPTKSSSSSLSAKTSVSSITKKPEIPKVNSSTTTKTLVKLSNNKENVENNKQKLIEEEQRQIDKLLESDSEEEEMPSNKKSSKLTIPQSILSKEQKTLQLLDEIDELLN